MPATVLVAGLALGCDPSPPGAVDDSLPATDLQDHPCPVPIEIAAVSQVGSDTVTLTLHTAAQTSATVDVWLDDARRQLNDPLRPAHLQRTKALSVPAGHHSVVLADLPSASPWHIEAHTSCDEDSVSVTTLAPTWPDPSQCERGEQVVSTTETTAADWLVLGDDAAGTSLQIHSDADMGETVLTYTLGEATSLIARLPLGHEVDLSGDTHLCVPIRGDAMGPDVALVLNLWGADADEAVTQHAWAGVRLENATDLPVRRGWTLDLDQLIPQLGTLDRTRINGLDIGVACRDGGMWSSCPGPATVATLAVGDVRAFNIDDHRVDPKEAAPVVYRPLLLREIEADLDAQVGRPCGPLLANGYDHELDPYRALYSNALALVVLAHAVESGATIGVHDSAHALADGLAALALPDGRLCAWPRELGCNDIVLDEALCRMWIGDQSWAGLALLEARRALYGTNASPWDVTIEDLVAWHLAAAQANAEAEGPGVFGASTEGTIDAWLFLTRAHQAGFAIADWPVRSAAILDDLHSRWDDQEQRLLIGPDHHHAALDVTGNLGTLLWRSIGDDGRANASNGTAWTLFATRSFDGQIMGMGDMTGPWTVNGEWGVGQYATAGGPHAEFVVQQFVDTMVGGGRAAAGADESFVGFLSWSSTQPWLPSTAWLYLAVEGRNFPALTADTSPDHPQAWAE